MSKILFLDIETAPNTAYVWGLFDQNIAHNQVETSSYILCWAAKWLGDKRIYWDRHAGMLKSIWVMLDQADIVVHYNGCKFDIPTLNKEFVKHGFKPPSPYKQIDMLSVCRRAFRFESNKLASVVKALGLGKKLETHGFELWTGCMKNDPKAWKIMQRYNKHDVVLLERLYRRLLPWITNHPSMPGMSLACPKCGSRRSQRRGVQVARSYTYPRFQCQACGGWFRGSKSIKGTATERGVSL